MPQMGETVTEGTITRWMKAVGDTVTRDEPLFEVSTDKVDTEVPSPLSGVLQEILVAEGDTVEVGPRLAVIADATQSSNDSVPAPPPVQVPAPPPAVQVPAPPAVQVPAPPAVQAPAPPAVQDPAPPQVPAPPPAPPGFTSAPAASPPGPPPVPEAPPGPFVAASAPPASAAAPRAPPSGAPRAGFRSRHRLTPAPVADGPPTAERQRHRPGQRGGDRDWGPHHPRGRSRRARRPRGPTSPSPTGRSAPVPCPGGTPVGVGRVQAVVDGGRTGQQRPNRALLQCAATDCGAHGAVQGDVAARVHCQRG